MSRSLNAPNMSHPLNRGRVAWWLCRPGWMGGNNWRDLIRGYSGTLAAVSSTNGWQGANRAGAQGRMLYDGSTGDITTAGSFIGSTLTGTVFTAAAWILPSAVGSYQAVFDGTNSSNRQLSMFLGGNASQIYFGA